MTDPSSTLRDLLGAHVSTAGGVQNAPRRAAELKAGAFQIFTKNQNQWTAPPLREETVAAWQHELREDGYAPDRVASHDSYLINLAATDPATLARSRRALVDEIERAGRLGIPWLVLHPGSHMGRGEAAGLAAVAESLDRCLDAAASRGVAGSDGVTLCLETTAGQGTNLGWRFAHLRDLIAASRHPARLAVCLDTCHVHAAGHDVASASGWRRTLARLDATVGLDLVKVVHLNDARRERASRVDRHARIGQGHIGREAFGRIVRTRRLRHALMILEVPGGEEAFAEDLALLRSLRRPGAASG